MPKKYRKRLPLFAAMRAHLLAGGEVKVFAYDHGLQRTSAGKLANYVGFRKYFLTAEEAGHIMERRKAQARIQESLARAAA